MVIRKINEFYYDENIRGEYGIQYCSIEVFSKPYIPEYVVLSDGSYEKIGTANIHHG